MKHSIKLLKFNKEDENLPVNIEVILSRLPIWEDGSFTSVDLESLWN